MLDRVCDYLRATLPQMRGEGATLGRELDLASSYLDVQKVRMGTRLAVAIDVPAGLCQLPFPSMMLLTVVENAVKHGLSPLPDGGAIAISARVHDGTLRVTVTDSGKGFSAAKGAGVGLSNIRARLSSLYGSAASLTLLPNAPRGIVAAIAIPT
jgi:LytS/YehU family sensor histidine kinase